ncbi:endonuclease/exonuclease/phosphatase family protein [Coralloluteibacterium thermophilus]|uniref:Endonuclease/exonuclease/phosphatase family protein n=1 Tax=Coralloluteibacterium thermophilum TaxID=2707049 RepID=A0ABV9NMD7_9GAMM
MAVPKIPRVAVASAAVSLRAPRGGVLLMRSGRAMRASLHGRPSRHANAAPAESAELPGVNDAHLDLRRRHRPARRRDPAAALAQQPLVGARLRLPAPAAGGAVGGGAGAPARAALLRPCRGLRRGRRQRRLPGLAGVVDLAVHAAAPEGGARLHRPRATAPAHPRQQRADDQPRRAPLLDLVQRERPDVLIAIETDAWWEARLDRLVETMPHVLRCPLDNLYGMHVYSRLPLEDAEIRFLVEDDVPSARATLRLGDGRRARLYCLHPRPPAPGEADGSEERDAELVLVGREAARCPLPTVVAGDLNDVAWSRTTRLFRRVSGLLDPRIGRGMFNTFSARIPVLRWPLDHLFHSDHFTLCRIARLPDIGSDHFPILVELALTPGANADDAGLPMTPEAREEARETLQRAGIAAP